MSDPDHFNASTSDVDNTTNSIWILPETLDIIITVMGLGYA